MSEPIRVACVWRAAPDFPVSTVIRLFKFCRKAAGDRPLEFYCLTPDVDKLPSPIIPLEAEHTDWKKFWAKVELFKPGLMPDRFWYFDLDTIVLNIPDYPPRHEGLYIAREWLNRLRCKFQSSVMLIEPEHCAAFYHDLVRFQDEHHYRSQNRKQSNRDGGTKQQYPEKGDQQFYWQRSKNLGIKHKYLQEHMDIASFKVHVRKRLRKIEEQDILVFHGTPRPQDCRHSTVQKLLREIDSVSL